MNNKASVGMINPIITSEVALMASTQPSYSERLASEIQQVPEEYLPALLTIVHSFRESVSLPTATESFEQGWKEAMAGETHPIETLWDGIEEQ